MKQVRGQIREKARGGGSHDPPKEQAALGADQIEPLHSACGPDIEQTALLVQVFARITRARMRQ